MLRQHYLGEGVSFSPPIKFGRKHSRYPSWFVDIFQLSTLKLSINISLDTRLLHGDYLTAFRNDLLRHLLGLISFAIIILLYIYVCCK